MSFDTNIKIRTMLVQQQSTNLKIGVRPTSDMLYTRNVLAIGQCPTYYLYMHIQGVSKALGQTSGVSSPHQNMEKKVHFSICLQTVCEVQPNNMLTSVLRFLCLGTLRIPSIFSSN
jgi:hypothetical protein